MQVAHLADEQSVERLVLVRRRHRGAAQAGKLAAHGRHPGDRGVERVQVIEIVLDLAGEGVAEGALVFQLAVEEALQARGSGPRDPAAGHGEAERLDLPALPYGAVA